MSRVPASADRQPGWRAEINGLYAITPDDTDTAGLVRRVRMALAGGVHAVQYRNKAASPALRREQGSALFAVCRAARVPFIINDDLDLADWLGADGVHLGRGDVPVELARARLGPGKLLGASCYDRFDLAARACDTGADYVAFGSAFPSRTKPDATHAPLSLYREAKARLTCPIVAIGGITSDNAPAVIDAGADAVAVISALFDAPDIERSARQFADLFSAHGLEKRPAV